MSKKEKDDHEKLYGYGGMLVVGLIVLILGLQQLNWIISLLGAFFSAFGGFEVKLTYARIQLEEKNIRARQSGHHNTQINQTSPRNSPVINKADNVYFGTSKQDFNSEAPAAPQRKSKKSESKSSNEEEWLFNGRIHFKTLESREIDFSKGDRILGHVESDDPISVQIVDERNFELFVADDDEEYETLWNSGKTTDYDIDYVFRKNGRGNIVIVDEYDEHDDEADEAEATVRLKIIRS